VLLEPFAGPLDERLVAAVASLAERGHRALVAHPERHPGEGMAAVLGRCVAAGALVQATAAHLAAGPASEALVDLARRGLVHVLGSDSHSPRLGRPVRLSDGLARLAAVAELRPHLDWIAATAPAAILAGDDLDPPIAPAAA
jgi:tyrosine-protein phosphatase YwqE